MTDKIAFPSDMPRGVRGVVPPGDNRDIFEYALIRVVPRVERGESINAGVIVYAKSFRYLAVRIELDERRLLALDPGSDVSAIRPGPPAELPRGPRFRWLTAPRSAIVQPGPVHAGLTADPAADLTRLFDTLVR
jgi:hypothetical protein